jgi:hypothetical protein
MREIEFLPDWYPRAQRRKRIVLLEGWLLFLLILGLGSWMLLAQRNVFGAERSLSSLKGQLDQMHTEQRMLDEQLVLRKELQAKEQLLASLGYPVEMTRLLQTIDSIMPKATSLTEFGCETEEQVKPVAGNTPAVGAHAGYRDRNRDGQPQQQQQIDRKLRVRIVGVAPSKLDLANFLAGFANVPFFQQVAVTYARDKSEAGHVLCEFEVTFCMDLNQPTGN